MKFLLRNRARLAVLAVVILILGMAVASFFTAGRTSPISSFINMLFHPLQSMVGSATDSTTELFDARDRARALEAENEHLRVLVAEMEEKVREAEAVRQENERLRRLFEFESRRREFVYENATIVQRDISSWTRTLTLSKGMDDGIAVGCCVLSAEGYLVGIVSQAGAGWSIVTTVIDTDAGAGAYIERTGQTAVAEGDWALMREGRLRLSLLPVGSDVQNGDLVLTSGLGGVYPKDIPIGTIVGIQTESTGQTDYAIIEPRVALDGLTQVFVVKSYKIEE